MQYSVTVPPNSTATLVLPAEKKLTKGRKNLSGKKGSGRNKGKLVYEIEAGKHGFEVK